MRKITEQAAQAFINNTAFCLSNTTVTSNGDTTVMILHGNQIAKMENGELYISCGGWTSVTTKERLNGLLECLDLSNLKVRQKDFTWYLGNGEEFNTDGWNHIK